MFEGNHLSMTCRLRDLEREFVPQIRDYRPKRTMPKFHAGLAFLVFVFVALTLGTAHLM